MSLSPDDDDPTAGATASALGSEIGAAMRDLWLAAPPDVQGPLLAFVHAAGEPSTLRAGLELGTDSVRLTLTAAVNETRPDSYGDDDGPRETSIADPLAVAAHVHTNLGKLARIARAAGLGELAFALHAVSLGAQSVQDELTR